MCQKHSCLMKDGRIIDGCGMTHSHTAIAYLWGITEKEEETWHRLEISYNGKNEVKVHVDTHATFYNEERGLTETIPFTEEEEKAAEKYFRKLYKDYNDYEKNEKYRFDYMDGKHSHIKPYAGKFLKKFLRIKKVGYGAQRYTQKQILQIATFHNYLVDKMYGKQIIMEMEKEVCLLNLNAKIIMRNDQSGYNYSELWDKSNAFKPFGLGNYYVDIVMGLLMEYKVDPTEIDWEALLLLQRVVRSTEKDNAFSTNE